MDLCPSPDRLRQLATGTLSGPDVVTIGAHVHACSRCREQFERYSATAAPEPTGADETTALPETFGRYRVLRRLGRGGMGTVYLAHDTQLDRAVALKVPRLGTDDSGLRARFEREARAAAALDHPHLCPVFDVGEIGGVPYLTMPFVEGEALDDRLRRAGPLPLREAAGLAARLARALAAAHRAGVVHRDVKPANVLLRPDGAPVVVDFGLARRLAAADPRLTVPGAVLCTPAYASPEQLGGRVDEAGPASDIYSLGALLYEMLAGLPPYQGSPEQVWAQVLTGPPAPPSRRRPAIDPRLEEICLIALAKEPSDRFASMDEFADALERYLSGDVTAVHRQPVAKPALRRPWVWGAAAVLALVLAGVLLWLILAGLRGPTDAPVPLAPPVPIDAMPSGSRWSGTYTFSLPADADGGDALLTVTARDGETFRGTYTTLQGKYAWRLVGTVRAGTLHATLVEVIREEQPQDVAGKAHLDGTLTGDVLELTYRDPDARATMTLRRLVAAE